MSERPLESLKSSAHRLAELMISESKDKNKIDALMRELGFSKEETHPGEPRREKPASPSPVPAERVGIWKPAVIKGKKYFIRDNDCAGEFNLWANVQKIPPKTWNTRVVLLGESVARGFLYDPYFTPASCLGDILNKALAPAGAEVVDLAKTNCTHEELKEYCAASLALKPDAAVVFAGNNWANDITFSEEELDRILELHGTGAGLEELKTLLERKYREMVVDIVTYIDGVFKGKRVPWFLLIPEFNLMDWKSNEVDRVLAWPRGETAQWMEKREDALRAMDSGDIDRAESLIRDMIRLNATNRRAYELLAECKLKRGAVAEAGEYFQMAQDTCIFTLADVPGALTVILETMAGEASRCNVHAVDLRKVFDNGGIPGKELFIDYCHLTAEGIQLAMAATARELLAVLFRKNVPVEKLYQTAAPVDNDVKARAHFFAAIHNAHKGQPYENLYYHCLRALELSDTIAGFFRHYIDMACRRAPWSLSRGSEALVGSGELSQYSMILQPTSTPIMDIDLVDAMAAALESKGFAAKEEVDSLRIEEHGLQNGKINLLESYYHMTSYMSGLLDVETGFYRAYDTQSHFFPTVPVDNMKIRLDLTCRIPNIAASGASLSVKVNDSEVSRLTVHDRWEVYSIQVPENTVKKGINRIELQWPADIDIDRVRRRAALKRKKSDRLKSIIYPIYGEIHMFTVSKIDE